MLPSALAPVSPLLLGAAMLLFGGALQGMLLPVRAQLESFDAISIGLIGSSYFSGFILGCFQGPRLVRGVGHIRTFTAIVAVASCTILLHAAIVGPVAWWIFRAITGFCLAILYLVIESWLNEKATNANRGMIFSTYVILGHAMATAGSFGVSLMNPSDFRIFIAGSIMISLAPVPIALSRREAPAPIKAARLRPGKILAPSPVAFFGCMGAGLANGSFSALMPVYAAEMGFKVSDVAILGAFSAMAAAISQWPLGRLSDRFDRRYLIIAASMASAMAGAALAIVQIGAVAPIVIGIVAFSAMSLPIYAMAVAHANDHAEPDEFVAISGGLLLVWAGGAVCGPILASGAMSWSGPGALFLFTAAMHVGLAAFSAWRISRRAAPAEEERSNFDEAVTLAQTVALVETAPSEDLEADDKDDEDDKDAPREELQELL